MLRRSLLCFMFAVSPLSDCIEVRPSGKGEKFQQHESTVPLSRFIGALMPDLTDIRLHSEACLMLKCARKISELTILVDSLPCPAVPGRMLADLRLAKGQRYQLSKLIIPRCAVLPLACDA
jgi:hypothetical protein